MLRYIRLYGHLLRFSFSRAMEFRIDFLFRFVMDIAFYAANLLFFEVLYGHTDLVGGWTRAQARVFLGGYFCVDAIHMTVFANNTWGFPLRVNRGDLDYDLVRPVSSLFFASLREFAASSFFNLLAAAGLLVWALAGYPGPVTAGRLATFLALIVNGGLLFGILNMIWLVPVFWLHTARGIQEVFHSLTITVHRPDAIYRGWVRRTFVSVLPFCLMASFPARALFDGPSAALLLHVAGVTAGALMFLVWFWRRGLRAYASASS